MNGPFGDLPVSLDLPRPAAAPHATPWARWPDSARPNGLPPGLPGRDAVRPQADRPAASTLQPTQPRPTGPGWRLQGPPQPTDPPRLQPPAPSFGPTGQTKRRASSSDESSPGDEAGRRRFTEEQHQRLDDYYQKDQEPDKDYRQVIADDCGLPLDSVTAWFASRRARDKRRADAPRTKRKGPGEAASTGAAPRMDDRLAERQTALVNLIGLGDVPKARDLLYGPQYGPRAHGLPLDSDGHTAVHWAAALGQLAMLTMLLEQGESTDGRNNDGDSALHRACMWHYAHERGTFAGILRLLAANLQAVNNRGQTCLHVACLNLVPGGEETQCKRTAAEAYLPLLLGQGGIDVNRQDAEGNTALGYCVEFANVRMARLLLEHGADAQLKNNSNMGVLDCAAAKTNRAMRRLLADHLGLPLADSPAPTPAPSTPQQLTPGTAGQQKKPSHKAQRPAKARNSEGEGRGGLQEGVGLTAVELERRRLLGQLVGAMEGELQQAQQSVQLLRAELREKQDRLAMLHEDNRVLRNHLRKYA